jgi:hypothetical protein
MGTVIVSVVDPNNFNTGVGGVSVYIYGSSFAGHNIFGTYLTNPNGNIILQNVGCCQTIYAEIKSTPGNYKVVGSGKADQQMGCTIFSSLCTQTITLDLEVTSISNTITPTTGPNGKLTCPTGYILNSTGVCTKAAPFLNQVQLETIAEIGIGSIILGLIIYGVYEHYNKE